ncbi:dialkylrecorsinol condensing enzyme [Simiduia aestuariiviva]|uniref:Putative membrane protein n=1 Tax=Simiduia aestuariiviva TaxID=1510459 RepID=A0A839UP79_9GAMM|nr:dialkylrecorsinol condensing enzyme [Simiduia aestuariiviva]MBB3168340.1 putative membrane protein [Simiduia aestuariiviva]
MDDKHSPRQRTKHILVPLYSQTGQLAEIVQQILAPLRTNANIVIHEVPIRPKTAYPFPWPFFRFLDVFPESIHEKAPAIEAIDWSSYPEFDLILLPYQVWYLAPSLPVQGLLQSTGFKNQVRGKPVITIIGCRNMWMLAQEKMKSQLKTLGARLLDNIVFTDQGSTLASFITVPRWMWTGRRNAFWGFPAAGVSEQDKLGARRFGKALCDALEKDEERNSDPLLSGLAAVTVHPELLTSEKAGTRSFYLWGKLLMAGGKPGSALRLPLLTLYICFLVLLIITIVPISLLLQKLLKPLLASKLKRAKHYYELPSGSGIERLKYYE